MTSPLAPRFIRLFSALLLLAALARAQVTTSGFLNQLRSEAPGTLLSHPITNGSEPIGRATTLTYLNGWLIVGSEAPGSRPGSDNVLRVYDIANPSVPVRRLPSDFNLTYPNNLWYGNVGWNAHGTAQAGNLFLPHVLRVASFGAPVELGGTAGIPNLGEVGVGYNRSSQAGPWEASFPWYGSADAPFTIQRVTNPGGYNSFRTLATFDHVGPYGGGDWHPMFFGDLLIYARSGGAARDGVVVYRVQYNDFDNPATRTITPQFVASLPSGFQGYWPNLFSDGTGLYVIGSTTNILNAANITSAASAPGTPAAEGPITLAASLTIPGFTNASYPSYQDNFAFIHNRKIDMTRFLAGDSNPIVLTLNEAVPPVPSDAPVSPSGVNTSQMSLALGNLWITGGYPINYGAPNPADYQAQGMAVWVHQQAPDTTTPRVSYHIPQAGRTNYPRHAPLSFLLHENPRRGGPRNGIDFTVRPVIPASGGQPESLGTAISGFLIHDFAGVLTFTPDTGLAGATTYQVNFLADNAGTPANLADDIGFQDAAGNLIEPYAFRFSTGGSLTATPPPIVTGLTASSYQPAPGALVTVTAAATGTTALNYRFNFDGIWTDWSATPSASYTYPAAGRPRVLVQIRDTAGNIVNDSRRLLVVPTPAVGPRPTQSTTLAVGDDPSGRRLWIVNPDAHTVSVLDAATGQKLSEYSTGANSNPRSIARDANGRYWITCHGTDQLSVLNPDGTPFATVDLPYGAAPFGIAPSPDGQSLFVTLYGSAQLHRYSAANPTAAPAALATFPTPRALAVSANGQRILVTRFISPDLEAEIADVASPTTYSPLTLTRTIRLSSANPTDGGDRASGVPNFLAAIAISPDGTRAAIASKQDNILRGLLYGVGDLTHETTVRAVVSFLDLSANAEIRHSRRDFDNSDSPSALAYSPLGDTLFVALQGNNRVVGLDAFALAPVVGIDINGSTETSPAVLTLELAAGLAPQGILIDPVANRLHVQNFMDRTVTVRNSTPFLVENRTTFPLVATTPTVATEPLSSAALLGKQIFYNAADPRMSADGYISCASCHVDGGSDGRIWDFTGRGEGLRRTTDLRGRSGLAHGKVHWSANFDEIQDFEHDMRGPFGGTGFLPLTPAQFTTHHPSPASGKAGLSPELDALAVYISSLTPATTPRSPARNSNGTLSAAAINGRTIFNAQSCTTCHSGPGLTDSVRGPVSTPNLHDLGTLSALSGLRLDGPLTGVDTPTLHGLHATRGFLHHGQADTLPDTFAYAGGSLLLAAQATLVGLPADAILTDTPAEGGGGFLRGMFGGRFVRLTGTDTNAVRFTGIDGGATGGPARLAIRHFGNATARLVINNQAAPGTALNLLGQYPDNGWQCSGWRWIFLDVTLAPGTGNTIELRRGSNDWYLNAILLANADDLAAAQPHRRVLNLSDPDRADLLTYLRSLDYRDDTGTPLATPPPPFATAPSIVTDPAAQSLAVGNPLHLFVSTAGTGPFTYQWRRGPTPVGHNSPVFELPSATLADAGAYTVTVTNATGQTVSAPAQITINPALAITTAELPRATVGRPYQFALAALGGTSTRAWTLIASTLPPGLALTSDGRIQGTPIAPARATLTLRVADISGAATRVLALDVRPRGGFSADPDLILHYTFDEGSGNRVWDAAPAGNNHATDVPNIPAGFPINGTASWAPDGRFGGAYGSADLASSLAPFFPSNQEDLNFDPRAESFTVSVWVRTTTPDGYGTILSKNGFADENWNVQYRLWTVNTGASLQGVSGNGWGGGVTTAPAAPLNNGQWQLVTLVNFLDGATWSSRLYVNGGANFTQWNTGAVGRVSRPLAIGDTSYGWNSWAGQLDDLRIYKRALTPAEITALYTPPAAPLNYDTWLATLPTLLAPEHRAPSADPDADGIPNLLEYALALDPMSAAGTGIPACVLDNPTQRLRLTYTRLRPDLDYSVEASSDLATWTTLATNSGLQGAETTVTDPISLTDSPRRFLRLRVSER